MRVLHVGKFFPPHAGGIERALADLLPAQRRAGVEVAAVVHGSTFGVRTEVEDFRGSPVWRVRTFGTLLYAPVSPSFPLALRRAIREFQPDVLHLHVPNTSAFCALRSRLPIVTHWHSDVVPSQLDRRLSLAYRAYRPLEKRLLRKSAAIIATSQRYLDSSAALQPYKDKCHVVPLGIDTSRLPEPDENALLWARQQWPARTFRVLNIGRMTYYKGQRHLIDAVDLDEALSVCIVGDGDLRAALEDRITRLNLRDRARLVGSVSDERVAALLAECDAFCLPSVERTEAFGIVLLEAMRYGKPIVAADVPGSGVGFVAEHGRNALLVGTEDASALAKALGQLHADEALVVELGEAGRRRLRDEFEVGVMAERVSKVYQSAMNRGASSAGGRRG